MNMRDGMLPIGSVVRITNGTQKLMICGHRVMDDKLISHHPKDYTGFLYPQGMDSQDELYSFQHEDIEEIHQVGIQNDEILRMRDSMK